MESNVAIANKPALSESESAEFETLATILSDDYVSTSANTSRDSNSSPSETSAERKTASPASLPSSTKRELHAERDDTAKKYKRIEVILDDKSRVHPLAAQEIRALLGICGPKPCSTSSVKLKRMPFERRRMPEQRLSTNEHALEDVDGRARNQ